ncbi:MAG: cellulase family glycosylhydrolase [Clostridia bacterium]|nr:cellulase family glycosylhydrolase [Clostridia bacterium]
MDNIFKDGQFFIGANYWASNAGIQMWNRWDEDCVKRDFDLLVKGNINVLRMFPLWSDFQPIEAYRNGGGNIRTVSRDAVKATETPEDVAGVDPVMVQRLETALNHAHKRGIRIILGILTGWMSGRVYVPKALDGLNLYTNPLALRWETRFVKYIVKKFKNHPAIVAWDLGNECNCFDNCPDKDTAYTWSALISNTIRSEDSTRPVVSGMHGIFPENIWNVMDQGELTDVLCTHPYPQFTPLCDTDPINKMKSANHAVAESLFYRGCGDKPCFAEEISVLGPMFGNNDSACANTDMALFGLWAHNCMGFMWWCACNQSALTDTPYDWTGLERELGLINTDGTHVPVMDTMTAFSNFVNEIGYLPPRITDAVCIMLYGQETWPEAYGTFLLAKQAGVDVEYMYCDNKLPDATSYIVPGLMMYIEPTKRLWEDILKKVHDDGANLYISMDGGMMSEFSDITGFELVTKSRSIKTHTAKFDGAVLKLDTMYDMILKAKTAKVLAVNEVGNPVFGVNEYGRGKVYFVSSCIERYASTTPGFADGENAEDYYRLYKAMNLKNPQKIASVNLHTVGITEHIINDTSRYILLINYEPFAQTVKVTLTDKNYKSEWIKSVDGNVNIVSEADGILEIALTANKGVVVKISK